MNMVSFSKKCSLLALSLLAACQPPVVAPMTTETPQQAKSDVQTTAPFQIQALSTPTQLSPLGVNLGVINDWSRSLPLVDLVKQARTFGSANAPWQALPQSSLRTFPSGDFGVVLFALGQGAQGVGGVYKFSFEGQATVRLVASRGRIQNTVYNAQTNLTTGEIQLEDDSQNLMLSFTQTGTGIRALKVLQPGYELNTQEIFSERLLNHIRKFKLLRLADWSKVNGAWRPTQPNPDIQWNQRVQVSDVRYSSLAGLPWEMLITLANQTRKDIWVNIPHMANDEYVRQLAALLKSELAPGLKVYVEYSNEVWNWGYAQTHWNFAQAQQEAASLNYDGISNAGYLAWRRTARRIKEISDIFRSVYGSEGFGSQFYPVLAAQFGNPETLRQGLQFLNSVYGPPENYLSATAGAPYFNHNRQADTRTLTAEQILDQLRTSANQMRPDSNEGMGLSMERNMTLSRYFNLPYMAYEGGPDTVGANNLEAKRVALASPGMENVCINFLNHWFSWGGGTFLWYQAGATNRYSQHGTFGLLENMNQPDTALNRCMEQISQANMPSLNAGFALPGTMDARLRVGKPTDWATRERGLSSQTWPGSVDYLLRVPRSGRYQFSLTSSSGHRTSTLPVLVNNRSRGTLTIPAGPNARSEMLSLDLSEGLQVLRLHLNAGNNLGYMIHNLHFEALPNQTH